MGDPTNMSLEERLQEIIKTEETYKETREFQKAQQRYTEWIKSASECRPEPEVFLDSDKPIVVDDFRKCISLAYNNRGQLKYLSVDFDGAVEDYDKAIQFNPKLASSYYNRGTIFYRMGYFDKAFEDITNATQLSPQTEEFLIGRRRCEEELEMQRIKEGSNSGINS